MNNPIKLKYESFPSQYVPDEEKNSIEFGERIGKAIEYEWFSDTNGTSYFYDRQSKIHTLRLYARGEQSTQKYKNELAINGDLSWLNLDWKPVPIIPKFVDIIANGMTDRLFKVKATAQDALSQKKRSQFQDMVEGQMVAKDLLENIQERTGVDPFTIDPDELPANDEELSLYMQMNYKPAIEIAEEASINTLMNENKYNDIEERLNVDLVTLDKAFAKTEFLRGSGVKVSYVDPADVVHSFTNDPHYKDCFYWGEVKTIAVNELLKINPDLSDKELQEIAEYGRYWNDRYSTTRQSQDELYHKNTCTVLYYNFKSTKKVKYKVEQKEDGTERVVEKDDKFDPPQEKMENGNFRVVDKTIDVWYDGVMVLGIDKVIKWELSRNMVRPKSAMQHALPNYVGVSPRMYKGESMSLVQRMMPYADLIQITHLKLQQVLARTVPDGVFIDADGLNEVDLGNGQVYNPDEALKLYFQTGSVIGRSYTQEGEYNHARIPIQELSKNSGASKVQTLIASYNHYLNMIRDVTGVNQARDGSDPDPRALVGVQKLAALNSNTATRHILDSSIFIKRSIAESLSYRVSDLLEYSDFKGALVDRVGAANVSILNEIKDLYLYDFGIDIEVSPDEEQKQRLENNIEMALKNGDINLEDAIDIREINNIKLANQLLKVKRQKKQEREEKMAMQKDAINRQANLQSQQLAYQTKMTEIEAEKRSKMEVASLESKAEIAKLREEARLKRILMRDEYNYNMGITSVKEQEITQRDKMKEDNKSKRISQNNEEQSKLIRQRQENLPPQNFESNEDHLGGIGLDEFGNS